MRLSIVQEFDPWKSKLCTCPPKYSLQPYTGCSHKCLYCYATSYIGYRESTAKRDVLKRLRRDLRFLDPLRHINISTSSDPYPPIEEELKLTRSVLKLLLPLGFRILITTKSHLVQRDADILSTGNAAVTITVTTMDESLARRLEPGAPPPSLRIRALEKLSSHGVPVGLRLDPILPYLNDDEHMIKEVLEAAYAAGVRFVVTSTYKARPDNLKRVLNEFPELEQRYHRLYRVEGSWVHGYYYLPARVRIELLHLVKRYALKLGMEFATCREGVAEINTARSCDGSHLIPQRISPSGPYTSLHNFLNE